MPTSSGQTVPIKGQCHEIFASDFFHESSPPQAPENNTRVILNLFAPPPVSTTLLANFDTSSTGVVDTSGNLLIEDFFYICPWC